jgi:hypothetical protein
MLENMVAFAMHDQRLRTAAKNIRLIEAERAAKRGSEGRRSGRQAIAHALTALALRVAPNGATVPVAPAQ